MEEKIKRKFVREEAYLKIRNWILDGTLEPGVKLKDKELAINLGVSRTPIREALLKLEDEGLVQTKPNSSTLVSSINFSEAFHLYSIIWTLEKLALSQAFKAIKENHIQAMTHSNEEFLNQIKINSRLKALEADHNFHLIYINLSQNKELEKLILGVKQKLKRLDLHYFNKIKNADHSYYEHKKIIEALKEKDLTSALDAIESNWKNSFSRFKI